VEALCGGGSWAPTEFDLPAGLLLRALLCLLDLQQADDGACCSASASLSKLHGARGSLFESHAARMVAQLAAEAPSWRLAGPASTSAPVPDAAPSTLPPAFSAFASLLRTIPPAQLRPVAHLLAQIFGDCCAPSDAGEPPPPLLARAALQLLDRFLETGEDGGSGAASLRPALAQLLGRALAPPLVWRSGKAAAAVRYAALVAMCTLLRVGDDVAAEAEPLQAALSDGLLHSLCSCLEEEYYADMRRAAAHALHLLCLRSLPSPPAVCAPLLSQHQRRVVGAAALRRLDDPLRELRVLNCQLAQSALRCEPEGWEAALLVLLAHCDDADAAVREAAAGAASAALAAAPAQGGDSARRRAAEAVGRARSAAVHPEAFNALASIAAGAL